MGTKARGSKGNREDFMAAEQWTAEMAASETREVLDNIWLQRSETTVAFGTKFFDADLNQLRYASADAALEVRLIRDPQEAVCRARFEIRTNLALFAQGASPAKVRQLVTVIAAAQRELADRAGLSFAEPGAAKPHVLTSGSRGLVRAHGKGNVFDVQDAAQPLLRAYWFLTSVWKAALIDQEAVTIARVRRIAEDAIAENLDRRSLFARRGDHGSAADGRPELSDELLARVGVALGCRPRPDGRYATPAEAMVLEKAHPLGIVRMVAEDLAAARGVDVDTVLRKNLQPMLAGEFDGPIVRLTAAEATSLNAALEECQTAGPPSPEN